MMLVFADALAAGSRCEWGYTHAAGSPRPISCDRGRHVDSCARHLSDTSCTISKRFSTTVNDSFAKAEWYLGVIALSRAGEPYGFSLRADSEHHRQRTSADSLQACAPELVTAK